MHTRIFFPTSLHHLLITLQTESHPSATQIETASGAVTSLSLKNRKNGGKKRFWGRA